MSEEKGKFSWLKMLRGSGSRFKNKVKPSPSVRVSMTGTAKLFHGWSESKYGDGGWEEGKVNERQ